VGRDPSEPLLVPEAQLIQARLHRDLQVLQRRAGLLGQAQPRLEVRAPLQLELLPGEVRAGGGPGEGNAGQRRDEVLVREVEACAEGAQGGGAPRDRLEGRHHGHAGSVLGPAALRASEDPGQRLGRIVGALPG